MARRRRRHARYGMPITRPQPADRGQITLKANYEAIYRATSGIISFRTPSGAFKTNTAISLVRAAFYMLSPYRFHHHLPLQFGHTSASAFRRLSAGRIEALPRRAIGCKCRRCKAAGFCHYRAHIMGTLRGFLGQFRLSRGSFSTADALIADFSDLRMRCIHVLVDDWPDDAH